MRRGPFDPQAYGSVETSSDERDRHAKSDRIVESEGREDRWAIRRNALSRSLVLDAQAIFECRMGRPVSENEARNLLGNLADYVWMLVQWEVSAAAPAAMVDQKICTDGARSKPRKSVHRKRKKAARRPGP